MSIRLIGMAAAGFNPPYGNLSIVCNSLAFGNGIFVGISASQSAVSTDGINWTTYSLPASGLTYQSIVFGNGVFSIIGINALGGAASSADGINWATGKAPVSSSFWQGSAYGNGYFIAFSSVSPSYLFAGSHDGRNYTAGAGVNLLSATYGNGVFVGTANTAQVSSDNGTTWTSHVILTGHNWAAVCFGAYADTGAAVFVAISVPSGGTAYVAISSDGVTWIAAYTTTLFTSTVTNLVYGNGKFVGTFNATTGQTSFVEVKVYASGSPTISVLTQFSMSPRGVAFGNNKFLAVGVAPNISQVLPVI